VRKFLRNAGNDYQRTVTSQMVIFIAMGVRISNCQMLEKNEGKWGSTSAIYRLEENL
jgi:hypothetical protein